MTLVSDVIHQARNDFLLAGRAEIRNQLTSAISSADEQITLKRDVSVVQPGSRLSVGLEDMHVWSIVANVAEVDRGQFGTAGLAHPANATVLVNAEFSDAQLLRAINDELRNITGMGLFRIKTTTIVYQSSREGFDLAAPDLLDIFEIRAEETGNWKAWPRLQRWELARDMPLDDFPSGVALMLEESGYQGRRLRVSYKASFDPLASLDQDVEVVSGLHVEAHDILALGAAVSLMSGKEIPDQISDRQGDSRRHAEHPAGSQLQSYRGLLQRRRERVDVEKLRLMRLYPRRLRTS